MLRKIQLLDQRLWFFEFRQTGLTRRLILHTERGHTFLAPVASKPAQAIEPTAFAMQLRKHLQPAWVSQVELFPGDRRLALHLDAPANEQEPARPYLLMVELMHTLGGNLFLLEPDTSLILGQAHQDLTGRTLHPGAPYRPLPPPPLAAETSWPIRWATAPTSDPWQAASSWYEAALDAHKASTGAHELGRLIQHNQKRLSRALKNVEKDLAKAQAATAYRHYGELLQSAYGKVRRGADQVEVPNYYDPDQARVVIALDPARSLQQNIDHYFKQYKRLHDAVGRIEERMLDMMEGLDTLELGRKSLEEDPSLQNLERWEDTLRSSGLLRAPQTRRSSRSSGAVALKPYTTYTSSQGTPILVGRGSKHNDTLSLKVARGRDVWMHARDWAGAHVILRQSDASSPPHSNDLYEAAMLAAHFSKGHKDTVVDVTHTRAKHIRKPKGAPPGSVTVAQGSTLAVSPDQKKLARLLATRQQEDA